MKTVNNLLDEYSCLLLLRLWRSIKDALDRIGHEQLLLKQLVPCTAVPPNSFKRRKFRKVKQYKHGNRNSKVVQ